jgi:hypothetical protein
MGQLNKRQVVILGIMVIMVIYGIYAFLGTPQAKKGGEDLATRSTQLKSFVSTLVATASSDGPGMFDTYVLSQAKADWKGDPFLERSSYRDWMKAKQAAKTEGPAAKKVTINYTGFVEAGGRKVAIINGVEYGVGDQLEAEGYVLRSILPGKIVVESRSDNTRLEVPFQE